ncbi:MAG: RusA family crossover junction endodeoxyribonuclease [Candidatus Omnitrophica bacterium]|nr:RusA family crossover junction endodeoxyribonuclease [Candidatus Omnitrophota bacterium]MDD5592670.1 RusA family crossover junction endodeoxyribonuclease [Candidatus Omnitrophota bacterium]
MLRTHWVGRTKEQKLWDQWAWAQWMARNKFIFLKPIKVLYIITFNSNRTRDLDNYIGGTKFITDALKKTFFFRDDAAHLKAIEVQFVNGEKEGTTVIISEA